MARIRRSIPFAPVRRTAALSRSRADALSTPRAARRRDGERGQMLVLAAFAFVVVLGFAGMVVDLGLLQNDRTRLQNALDSAALSAGHFLPVDGSVTANVTKIRTVIDQAVTTNYPGVLAASGPTTTPDRYWVTYRCLIGVDTSTNLAWVSRDVPAACDNRPSLGLGSSLPSASLFTGSGPTRSAPCDPSRGDRCNAVVVSGHVSQRYYFAPAVGALTGSSGLDGASTGDLAATACNGPCGNSPVLPVDLAIVLDRTMSMSAADITALQDAAKAVLQAYDPAKQRVALVLTGPSQVNASGVPTTSSSCPAAAYGLANNDNWTPLTAIKSSVKSSDTTITVNAPTGVAFPATTPFGIVVDDERMTVTKVTTSGANQTWTVTRPAAASTGSSAKTSHSSGAQVFGTDAWAANTTNSGMWVPVGLSGTDTTATRALPSPNGTAGRYSTNGVLNASSDIVKSIQCISSASNATDLATPIAMARWYLDTYGRKGVAQGIIIETDGKPQYGFGSHSGSTDNQAHTSLAFTCKAASDAARAAKADTTNSPDGIQIYTVGYGVSAADKCPITATSLTQRTDAYNVFEGADGKGVNWSGQPVTTLLRSIATDPTYYYENATAVQLKAIFTAAAAKLAKGGSHLVNLCPAPQVSGVSPASWAAGATVTITGQNLTGATSVRIGGAAPRSFSVGSDSSITAVAASTGSGSASVTTSCGNG